MARKKSSQSNKDFIKMMFIIGIIGIVVIILTAVIMFKVIVSGEDKKSSDNEQTNVSELKDNNKDNNTDDKDIKIKRIVAVIKKVDVESKIIELLTLEGNESVNLQLDDTIKLKDKYGEPITFEELSLGDIIKATYDENTMKPEEFRISAEGFEKKNVNNVVVDTNNKTIIIGNDKYSYDDELILISTDDDFNLSKLTKVDKITVKGYKDKILTLELEKSHGYVSFENYDSFIDGVVDIDRDKSVIIENNMKPIILDEGVHKIVVNKEGYEPFVTEVMIVEGNTEVISLGSAQVKKGSVEFRFNVDDVELYINDELQENIDKPIILDYGQYKIVAKSKKEGTEDFEGKLTVNKPYFMYSISFKQKQRMIFIQTKPDDVEVYIDGTYAGKSPVKAPIISGEHKIELSKDGYESKTFPINVEEGNEDVHFSFPTLQQKNSKSDNEEEEDDFSPYTDSAIEQPKEDKKDQDISNDFSTPINDVYNN